MKQILSIYMLLLGWMATGCSNNEAIIIENEITQEGAVTLVLKGYESASEGFSICQPEGFTYPFYIQDRTFHGDVYWFVKSDAGRLDAMQDIPVQESGWQQSIDIEEESAYWAWCMGADRYRFLKFRVLDIEGNNVTIEYAEEDAPAGNLNANTGDAYLTEYEMPCLNDSNVFVAHDVTVDGKQILNYALEWNAAKRHANWVAFSFDKTTSADEVSRTNAWAVDEKLPEEMRTEENDHKDDGFDKGHLCASEDRVYSKEANEQTFYYSNMSPQLNDFNGGFWRGLEEQVQTWGRSTASGTYDKVYVAKGGTLNELLVNFNGTHVSGGTPTTDENGFTIHGLACPASYFMAVLTEKGNDFHAIAFLIPHQEGLIRNPKAEDLQKYVIPVDELERKTGIDFFCNLDDAVENQVEAEAVISDWSW
ncbi:DNA/RNA non-specific endonuclease [Bacteroides gallinaceum]|uniref:DNA/RNA non-specific endonuclease n=1 Tax=Bacteroides gallinaceum TaxID=1462571 RepID=UPI0025AA6363|nr:DNA/RNA non-specific endonuclease [Bacteroides gallinaceum]MDN0079212.1 DNA/RNA non-specific endonuclease [Bacteroides gallinaceum]